MFAAIVEYDGEFGPLYEQYLAAQAHVRTRAYFFDDCGSTADRLREHHDSHPVLRE